MDTIQTKVVSDRWNVTLKSALSAIYFPWRNALIRDVLSHIVDAHHILDVGCGIGTYSFQLVKKRKCHCVGMDIDLNAIILAKTASNHMDLKGSIEFMVGDIMRIPIQDNSVDVILCFEVLEHVAEYDTVLKEMYRVLRKGGILILTSPTSIFAPLSIDWLEHQLRGKISLDEHSGHVYRFKPNRLLTTLKEIGFEMKGVRFDAQYLQPLLTFSISRFGKKKENSTR